MHTIVSGCLLVQVRQRLVAAARITPLMRTEGGTEDLCTALAKIGLTGAKPGGDVGAEKDLLGDAGLHRDDRTDESVFSRRTASTAPGMSVYSAGCLTLSGKTNVSFKSGNTACIRSPRALRSATMSAYTVRVAGQAACPPCLTAPSNDDR